MSDALTIALTAGVTLGGGVLLFVISQLLQKFVLEPLHEQRKVVGDIDYRLTYWAWAYANPQDAKTAERDKAMDELRDVAGRLLATTNAIRCWRLSLALGAVAPGIANEASRILIGLSNGVYGRFDHNHPPSRDAQRLRDLLRIPLAGRPEQSAEGHR
ncbi:MAG: hypothetical protein HY726_03535 [Candidatus Rokubacteria bacterium]|nr:hypothetical protein [Candidatus Rokubacteria bacterium]